MALTLPLRHAGPIAPRAVALSGGLHQVGMFFLLAGAFLPIMDFFITNVALPSIDASLHASAGELELVIAGYGWRTRPCWSSAAAWGTATVGTGSSWVRSSASSWPRRSAVSLPPSAS